MANPTTNYGFVLPTATDLVTDLPADFDVALQGVDTRLKALQPGTTLGDLAYSSATANTNTRLGIGSTGNVLTVASGVPVWSAPASGGKVLQVVQGTKTTNFTTSSATAGDTGLSVTITPSSATSKVLVLVSHARVEVQNTASSQTAVCFLELLRGSTMLQQTSVGVDTFATVTGRFFYAPVSFSYLDSPATTSATTYKTQAQIIVASAMTIFGAADRINSIVAMEIGA
jgi:hypothetical protein